MQSDVANTHIFTLFAVVFISFWIVISVRKLRPKKCSAHQAEYMEDCSEYNHINHICDPVVAEIYAAAKSSDNKESLEKCINLLRQYPGHMNTPASKNNFTPFLRACWTGSTCLVQFMLENGADISRRTSFGESAFYLAVHKVANDINEWDPSLLNLLYKAGCCLNARREHGYSPLHVAAEKGHVQLVGWLLSHGADPSASTMCGRTPIDFAFDKGHKAVIEMLTIRVSVEQSVPNQESSNVESEDN